MTDSTNRTASGRADSFTAS